MRAIEARSPRTAWATEVRRICAGCFALQAAVGVALWVSLATSDTVRSWVELHPPEPAVTDAFFLADMVVVVASALAAWAIWSEAPWTMAAVGFTAGGIVYPTVYLVSFVAATGKGTVPLAMMIGASAVTLWAGWLVWRLGRQARPPTTGSADG